MLCALLGSWAPSSDVISSYFCLCGDVKIKKINLQTPCDILLTREAVTGAEVTLAHIRLEAGVI